MGFFYFDQQDYVLEIFADKIQKLINHKDKKPEYEDEFTLDYKFTPEVLKRLKEGVKALKAAQIYVHRIDWLIRENDTQQQFLRKLTKELDELENPE